MSDFRRKLVNRVISIYGNNHEKTISFTHLCRVLEENELNNTSLRGVVEVWEKINKVNEAQE